MSDESQTPPEPEDNPRSVAPFDSGESLPPEETARWQRPPDRFPMLPEEEPQTAPLKEPPVQRAPRSAPRSRTRSRNLITVFFLLASCGVIAYVAIIWQNPYSALNPLAPPTPLPQVITATYTPTFTLTPSPTLTPTVTDTPTPIPSLMPTFTFTPIFLEGFSTPQGTPPSTEDAGNYQFTLQHDHVLYLTNPQARGGCRWSSIAGSVMDYGGAALKGYGVHVVGGGVDQTVGTGTAPGFGPGGFEVPLGSVARDAQYVAQLLDPQGNPVSPVYTVVTKSDCNFNIAALRFVEVLPSS